MSVSFEFKTRELGNKWIRLISVEEEQQDFDISEATTQSILEKIVEKDFCGGRSMFDLGTRYDGNRTLMELYFDGDDVKDYGMQYDLDEVSPEFFKKRVKEFLEQDCELRLVIESNKKQKTQ